ncbi:MAG: D-glycero-beta-D-manno-heptose 1,7-bisphosphate 7-phosphatase [Pseudomonadota bacterium]
MSTSNSKQPAIFLDRDGVINLDHEYVYQIKDFIFIDDVFSSCLRFQQLGYQIVIITNQSGIARGYYTPADFEILNQWMLEQFKNKGIDIKDVYYCPHHAEKGIAQYKIKCDCRKPQPGMLLQAAKEHNIDLPKSILIGDNISDIKAGKAAGLVKNFLVSTGKQVIIDKEQLADKQFDSLNSIVKYLALTG